MIVGVKYLTPHYHVDFVLANTFWLQIMQYNAIALITHLEKCILLWCQAVSIE